MTWCPCLRWCCPDKVSHNEVISLTSSPFASSQSYTVRRISSFGQTFINEKGEEEELARHTSLVQLKKGQLVPWASAPSPVQPGVTQSDVVKRITKMPVINEGSLKESKSKKVINYSSDKKQFSPLRKKKVFPHKIISPQQFNEVDSKPDPGGAPLNEVEGNDKQYTTTPKSVLQSSVFVSTPDLAQLDNSNDGISSKLKGNTLIINKNIKFDDITKSSWLKSQSMMNIATKINNGDTPKSANIEEQSDEEVVLDKSEELAKLYGLDLSLYKDVSDLSPDVCHAFIPDELTATLNVTAHYSPLGKTVSLKIEKVEDLAGDGIDNKEFQMVIKLTLLQNHKHLYTTKPVPCWSNVNQAFSIPVKDISQSLLRLSLFNAEWQGTHDVLGHALFYLRNVRSVPSLFTLNISRRSSPAESVGKVLVKMSYQQSSFRILVNKTVDLLPNLRDCKLYIKISYFHSSRKVKEKVSQVKYSEKDFLVYNLEMNLKTDPAEEKHSYILISLKKKESNKNLFKHDKTIGRVFLGPAFYQKRGESPFTTWASFLLHKQTLSNYYLLYL